MSLNRWKELAKQKTELGNKTNFVRDTITKRKLGEETSQLAYEKMFKPITSKLDTPVTVETPKVAKEKSLEAIDYYPDDDEEEVFPEQDKQIPEDPPTYSPGKYMQLKQQRALGEKEIFERYNLPIIETQETPKEALEAYDSVVKELGKEKRKLTNAINRLKDSPEKENLKKIREQLRRDSYAITERRDKLKKTGKVFVRKTGGNLILYRNPKDLLKKLELIIGEFSAGNTNIDMYNTGFEILDVLLKNQVINKLQHEKIFKKYFRV